MKQIFLRHLFLISVMACQGQVFSQNVSINTTGAANSSLSMLEVLQISTTANTKGLFISHTGTIAGTGYGLWVEKTGGGGTTNIAGYFSASGAGTNYAIIIPSGGGKVGIGVSAPSVAFEVAQNGAMRLGDAYLSSGSTGGSIFAHYGINAWFDGTTWTVPDATKKTGLIQFFDEVVNIYQTQTAGLTDFVNRFTVISNGNIGLTEANPAERLEVNGRIKLAQLAAPGTTTDRLYNVGGNLYWAGTQLGAAGASSWSRTAPYVYPTTLTDFVGIGTATPTTELTINGSLSFVGAGRAISKGALERLGFSNCGGLDANNPFWISYGFWPPDAITLGGGNVWPVLAMYWNYNTVADPTNATFNYFLGNAGGLPVSLLFGTETAGNIDFQTTATTRMHIAAAGNVGIGTITPGTALQVVGGITSTSATAGLGYATGAGGTVTQATNKTTGVTINKVCGQITMNGAALANGAEAKFTVTNSTVAAADVPVVAIASVGTSGSYLISVSAVAAGSFDITISNVSAGSLSQAVVINFVIIKAVTN